MNGDQCEWPMQRIGDIACINGENWQCVCNKPTCVPEDMLSSGAIKRLGGQCL